jgi:hypothetical protein
MEENLVTVMTFSTLWEAEMAASRLESEDVPAYLKDGETVNMNWLLSNAVGGVKVQVTNADLRKAKEILSAPVTVDAREEGETEDVIVCPRCKNEKIQYAIKGRRWTFLTWILFGIPLLWPRKRLFCSRCGYNWR